MNSIERIVFDRFDDFLNRHVNGSGRLETIHVSDLISPCLRKSYYSMKYEEPEKDQKTKGILYLGQAVHNFSKMGEIHEEVLCYDFKAKTPVSIDDVKNMTKEERRNVLTGAPDDIILHPSQGAIVIDKKTWYSNNYPKKVANQQHIEQVNIYKWLLWKCKGISVKHAVILYLDIFTRFEKPLPIQVELSDLVKIETMVYGRIAQLQRGFPEKNVCWLCDGINKTGTIFCPWKDKCDKEEE